MFIDPAYLLMVFLPALLIGGLASMLTKSTFVKYSRIDSYEGYTGAEAAAEMLRREGVHDVAIEPVSGFLSDHYNPMTKTLALSEDVYASTSLSAVGVACHEAGHAIRHARGFAPLWARSALVPMTQFCSSLYIIPIILAFITRSFQLGVIGLAMCAMGLVFALVTLPVEWDASRRAKLAIARHRILNQEEASMAGAVLNAAFLTYVAAVVSALLTVLYWAFRLGLLGGRRSG